MTAGRALALLLFPGTIALASPALARAQAGATGATGATGQTGAIRAAAGAYGASPVCQQLPAPPPKSAAAPGGDPVPVAYDIRLEPDLATGVLREHARVALRNPGLADSVELTLNDWFDSVSVSAAGAHATLERETRGVMVHLAPARRSETLCFELAGKPERSGDEERSVIGRETIFLLWSDVFYPLDYNAWATVRLTIALPAGFKVLGPGHEVGTAPAGNAVVHTFVSDHPLRIFSVMADRRWIETRRTIGGLRLRTLLYPGSQQYADSLLRRSADVLSAYAGLFGPYAFDDFAFATVDSMYARRALAGAVVYEPGFLEREMTRTGFDGHETALLWWFYTTTGRGPGAFQWTEGLGDYAEYLYDEQRGKPLPPNWPRFRAQYLALAAGAEPAIGELHGSTPQAIVHGKYPWLLHLLRFATGDDAFRRALRDLFVRYRYRAFTLDEMVSSFESSTGRKLTWWKDGWLLRTGVPDVHFTSTVEPDGERWRIVGRLEQATPPFTFPAEIGLFAGARPLLQRVQVDSAAQSFVLTSPVRPDSVVLDPRGWVIMRRR